jgi:hypothetical protein
VVTTYLPAKTGVFGGDEGSRTLDLRNAIAALSQLSYVPIQPVGADASRACRLCQIPRCAFAISDANCAREAVRAHSGLLRGRVDAAGGVGLAPVVRVSLAPLAAAERESKQIEFVFEEQ